jgi:hypothetical protein
VNTTSVTPDNADAEESSSVTPDLNWAAATADPKDEESDTSAEDPSIESMWAKRPTEEGASDDDATDVPAAEGSSWSSKWPESSTTSTASDSPADRFREALDTQERATDVAAHSTTDEEETISDPEPNHWSWGAPDDEEPVVEESVTVSSSSTSDDIDEIARESETITLPSDTGFSAGAETSGATPGADTPEAASGGDARERATALIDELRGLIWKIGEEELSLPDQGQNQTIISNMKRVRGETSDFSDLRGVIVAVRENPRDIDALRDLGQQADRLQALLDSHAALTSALEDAIRQGR